MSDKLIITRPDDRTEREGKMLRISPKAYALLDSLAKESGRSRSYIAGKMIEYAFDRVEITDGETEDEA